MKGYEKETPDVGIAKFQRSSHLWRQTLIMIGDTSDVLHSRMQPKIC